MPPKKPKRRLQRPYQKADISVEDQQNCQQKLLQAAKEYEELNQNNLQIIAISFEHRCFSESKTREEYLRRVQKQLNEWNYTGASAQNMEPTKPQQNVPRSTQAKAANQPPRLETGPPGLPGNFVQQPGFPRTSTPPYTQAFSTAPPISPTQGGFLPQQQPFPYPPPTPTLPFPQNQPPQIPPPPTPSSFYDLFNPEFLAKHDLNDPNVRNQWIKAVWDFFVSGGTPYSTPPGGNESPVVPKQNIADQLFNQVQGIQQLPTGQQSPNHHNQAQQHYGQPQVQQVQQPQRVERHSSHSGAPGQQGGDQMFDWSQFAEPPRPASHHGQQHQQHTPQQQHKNSNAGLNVMGVNMALANLAGTQQVDMSGMGVGTGLEMLGGFEAYGPHQAHMQQQQHHQQPQQHQQHIAHQPHAQQMAHQHSGMGQIPGVPIQEDPATSFDNWVLR